MDDGDEWLRGHGLRQDAGRYLMTVYLRVFIKYKVEGKAWRRSYVAERLYLRNKGNEASGARSARSGR